MIRLMAILCFACLTSAVFLALRPDAWDKAEQKAVEDAGKLVNLIARPDRIGWRMSEDVSLLRVMIWDQEGARQYPPPGGMAPLAYEFSEDEVRLLSSMQSEAEPAQWTSFDTQNHELLHCRATQAVCLIYERALLEEALELRPDALLIQKNNLETLLFLSSLVCLLGAIGLWVRQRPASTTTTLILVPERHIARRGALEIALTTRDLTLLSTLMERGGEVITKDELYDAGWGRDYMPNSRALDQHIVNLRRKLDPDKSRPVIIETVHGVGYRLAQ